jgi:hypothetical protein
VHADDSIGRRPVPPRRPGSTQLQTLSPLWARPARLDAW